MAQDELQAEEEKQRGEPAQIAESKKIMGTSYHPLYYDESGLDYK